MDCHKLEERLEALVDGTLDEVARRRAERHLEECAACRQLVEPFATTAPPPEDLLGAVLARTSGPACGRSEGLLASWLDGELAGASRELMAEHLDSCADCRALAAAMRRLEVELPELAELRPDPGFVAAVLAATLPLGVRLRRWWTAVWPRWVRRPRFASEAAFVGTLALVLVFATPGSPLEAVPSRALELARTDPAAEIEARLEAPVATLGEGFATRIKEPLSARYASGEAEVRAWLEAAETRSRGLAGQVAGWLGTTRDRLASLLGSADETASDGEDAASNQEQETP